MLDVLASVVEECGHQPITAANGREALQVLRASSALPGLILSDVMMPHLNGVALAQALRADPQLQHIPLVLMSAAAAAEARHVADVFISKPFNLEQLEAVIKHYMERLG